MHIPNAEDYFVQRKATWDIKFHAGLLHKIQLLQPTLLTVCYIRYSNPIPSYNIDFEKGHLPVQAVHWALGFNHLGYNSKSAKSLFMSSSSSEDSFAMYSEHLEKSQHILIVGVGGIKMSDQLIILPSYLIFVIFLHSHILSHENFTLGKCVNLRQIAPRQNSVNYHRRHTKCKITHQV